MVNGTTGCNSGAALNIFGPGALPVNLISFTAKKEKNTVQLTWKTAVETNNKGFQVQRSKEGTNWTNLGFVKGAGNSISENNYQFTDEAPPAGKSYSRFIQYDLDNSQWFSPIVTLDFDAANKYYVINANGGNDMYQLTVQSAGPTELSVVNMAGQKLWNKTAGQGVYQIDLSQYPAGLYILQLKKDGKTITEKLTKR